MEFSKITTPRKANLLMVFMDIQGFGSIAQRLADPLEMFDFMNDLAERITRAVHDAGGRVIKFVGDECLLVFPEESVDKGVLAILRVKADCESHLAGKGFANKLRVTAHFGEAALGMFGIEPCRRLDVFGESVNTAASLGRNEHRGRLILSPQAFRRLDASTRRRFHKFTEPIVYLAQE